MQSVLSRYEADGGFKTFRNNQRPYKFRGFFEDNTSAGYKKNTFSIMTKAFVDSRGETHKPGTIFFNGPQKDLMYNISVDEFFDRFSVTESSIARRKSEFRKAMRVTDDMLNEIVLEERMSGVKNVSVDSITLKIPWDGRDKRVKVGDYILSHRGQSNAAAQYIPVDREAFNAIYIENSRNIRSARKQKAPRKEPIAPPQI